MAKDTNSEFLKEFDRFGQPVGLTYKNNPSYNTPIGGVFTMIAFFIFMMWLALETIDVYMPPGKFTTTLGTTLTQAADGSFPVYNMTVNEFNIVYRAVTTDGKALPQSEVNKYITAMWIQLYFNETDDGKDIDPENPIHKHNETDRTYYMAKPCKDLYSRE